MSSMLKKAGAGAFKPKAPMTRRRPAPNVAAQNAADSQTTEAQPDEATVQEPTPGPSQDAVPTASPTAESQQKQPNPPAVASSKEDASAVLSESPRTTARKAPKSPEARRVVPGTRASPASKPKQSAAPPSETLTEPAAPAEAPTVQASSTQPDKSTATSQGTAECVTSSSQPDTASSKPTELGKNTPAGGTKPTPSKNAQKPKPIAETSMPEGVPSRAARSLPTLSADSATPSVENGDGPSKTPGTKATNTSRKQAARQPRKRKADATTGEAEAGAEAEGPPRKKRAPRKKKTTTNGADGEARAEGVESAVPKRRTQRKRKAANYAEENGGEEEGERGEGDEDLEGSESGEQAETQKPKKRGRKRSVTPEDAENITIDPETITLGQLTRDPRTGKRWDKAALIQASEQERKREKQRQQLIEKGLLKEGEELPGGGNSEVGTPAPNSSTPAPAPAPEPAAPAPAPGGGLRYRIVDGQIVLDDTTLQHDRHAEADEARGDLEAREEHEFSRRTTKYTLMRRKTPGNSWTSLDTERFYDGLRSFGTDFEMISQMFGGAKSRRQVKLKFNREERANPAAVNACLVGEKTVPMTLDAIHGFEDLEESEAIKDELAREREEREAEARREEEERAAENRQKAADLGGRGKKARDRGRATQPDDDAGPDDGQPSGGGAAAAPRAKSKQKEAVHPGAKYGVGTDPDVIDETDLPTPSTRGGRAGRGRGRGGRRGGMISFGSGFGA